MDDFSSGGADTDAPLIPAPIWFGEALNLAALVLTAYLAGGASLLAIKLWI